MAIKDKLLELEKRIVALEERNKTIENLEGYKENEIRLIEEEATSTVIQHLQNTYQSLLVLTPAKDYVKYLYDPLNERRLLTEFDGLVILSNYPDDIANKKLDIRVTANEKLDSIVVCCVH